MSKGAWRGWYHCGASAFGTWLPGDPRGFRTRDHREHVEGDYKAPPPRGKYERRHDYAHDLLQRPPVELAAIARAVALAAMVHAWVAVHGVEVLAVAVAGQHMHVLARFGAVDRKKPTPLRRGLRETDPARFFVGIAKERSAKALAAAGLVAPGGVWARRGKIVPIRDRRHQVNVYRYILEHAQEGAAVWHFKQELPQLPDCAKKKPTP